MARGDNIANSLKDADVVREAEMQARLKSGESIHMEDPDGRIRYVDNTDKAIRRKVKQGWKHITYEETTVKTPVPLKESKKGK